MSGGVISVGLASAGAVCGAFGECVFAIRRGCLTTSAFVHPRVDDLFVPRFGEHGLLAARRFVAVFARWVCRAGAAAGVIRPRPAVIATRARMVAFLRGL